MKEKNPDKVLQIASSDQHRNTEQIQRQLEFHQIATEVVSMFAGAHSRQELDLSLNKVLQVLGEFFGADRSYIFQFSADGTVMSNTHEWCEPSTTSQKDHLQDLPVGILRWWNESINTLGQVHIPDVEALPPKAEKEREEFRSQNIRSLLGVPMQGAKGKVIGFFGFDRVHSTRGWSEDDISMVKLIVGLMGNAMERVQAVLALLESETRHTIAFEQSRDAIVTVAPPTWNFNSGNPAAVRVFGATNVSEFMTCNPGNLSPERQPDGRLSTEKSREMIEIALRDGSSYFEWVHRKMDGTDFPTTVLLTRMQAGGQDFVHAVIRDDTERKRAEARERALKEQIERAQRIESLGQLTGGIAHDFNNLLTVILGNAELIRMLSPTDSPVVPLVVDVVKAAQRGAELTQALLAFARRQALEPAVVDLNELVVEMRGLLERTLGEHIEVRLDLATEIPPALVDRAQLESALLNLCLNSRDAMGSGGHLIIETGRRPGKSADETRVTLSVIDTGCGIPSEDMSRLFEPFFTTKPKGKGTGLGLPMVHGFVEQSGGEVEVESTPGKGTAVRLLLPLADSRASSVCLEDTDDLPSGTESILLVEDDELVRNFTHDLLTNLGYSVKVASNGPDALEIVRQGVIIDLLFTDVMMPGGLNGRELAQTIHQLLPDLPVLYMSGYTEGLMQGETDVDLLHKPYRRVDLARRIRARLDSRRPD